MDDSSHAGRDRPPVRRDNSLEAAYRVLDKVRLFAAGLSADERELFAALVGPGVALAYRADSAVAPDTPDTPDTDPAAIDAAAAGPSGPSAIPAPTPWGRERLPQHLADAVRSSGLRVTGW